MMIRLVLRRDLRQDFLGAEGEAVLLLQRDRHGLGAGVLDHRAIDREARIGIHDLLAGRAEHQDREEHRRLAAGHDDDVAGIDLDAVALFQVLGDRLAQRQDALRRRIAVVAIAQRLDGGFDDVARRLEVGLADAEIDDRLTLPLQFAGARQDLEGILGAEAIEIVGELQRGGHQGISSECVVRSRGSLVKAARCPKLCPSRSGMGRVWRTPTVTNPTSTHWPAAAATNKSISSFRSFRHLDAELREQVTHVRRDQIGEALQIFSRQFFECIT